MNINFIWLHTLPASDQFSRLACHGLPSLINQFVLKLVSEVAKTY